MVEGPGCKVKGEIMRKRIKGKVISDIKAPEKSNQAAKENSSYFLSLSGRKVSEVRTLGKELFIFLEESLMCIRIHFLMDGSVRYGTSDFKSTRGNDPSLIVFFPHDKLIVFQSSVTLRSAKESIEHCDSFADLDICSPTFNFKRAQERIEERQCELICDVIMDQTVLPGVGNIIKNEGLFKSGINPNTFARDLSSSLVLCLLHRLRDFSAVFYMCRKNNKPLKQHLCIYEKNKCTQCGNQVTVCKPGNLSRLTFFCSLCQVNSNSSTTLLLPKKNSLLGFLQLSDETKKDGWQCPHCTFINITPSLVCSMCFFKIADSRKRKLSVEDTETRPLEKRVRPDTKPSTSRESSNNTATSNSSDTTAAPCCSGHQKTCSIRTVTRSGGNKGRMFYCCSIRGDTQCKFFQWADLHHPMCKHGKRTVVRRVLKQNANNGREFYCCPLPKSDQCEFFQWIEKK